MPKERRTRVTPHRLAKNPFAVPDASDEADASTSGHEILEAPARALPGLSKKEKQRCKHEAFIDKLVSSVSPYSKAQRRRFNKKTREQIGGGMADMGLALSALQEKDPSLQSAKGPETVAPSSMARQTATSRIGKGKGVPLTKAQRKRTLEIESLRHPLVLSDPRFADNPFETIRIHARNTLEKKST